jgi:arylsulfatase A-like enzyme
MGYDALRTERYKYIRFRELAGMDELYDLDTDPWELQNLVASSAHETVVDALKAELRRLLER